jgi:hypothetical protein
MKHIVLGIATLLFGLSSPIITTAQGQICHPICLCPCADLGASGSGVDPLCHEVLDFSFCETPDGCCPVDPACPNRKCAVALDIKGSWGNCPCAGRVKLTVTNDGTVTATAIGGPDGAPIVIRQELKCGKVLSVKVESIDCFGTTVPIYQHTFACEYGGGCPHQ